MKVTPSSKEAGFGILVGVPHNDCGTLPTIIFLRERGRIHATWAILPILPIKGLIRPEGHLILMIFGLIFSTFFYSLEH